MNHELLLWGTRVNRVSKLQKKAVRIISNSEYLAHSEPLFKTLKLLKIDDLYKLKLMKFYYNLSYNVLPSYFNYYLEVIDDDLPCQYTLRQTACPLGTHTQYPEILEKLNIKLTSILALVTMLKRNIGMYIYECTNLICYKCGRM